LPAVALAKATRAAKIRERFYQLFISSFTILSREVSSILWCFQSGSCFTNQDIQRLREKRINQGCSITRKTAFEISQ
jgi:hypothetical protein